MLSLKSNRGFTLIELMVVIAIIGILSTIVMVSLSDSRNKAKDTTIQSDLGNIRAQAEIYYANNNNKFGVGTEVNCTSGVFSNPTIQKIITSAKKAGATGETCQVVNYGQKYAISMVLKSGTGWCVDSSGASKAGNAVAGSCQ